VGVGVVVVAAGVCVRGDGCLGLRGVIFWWVVGRFGLKPAR